MKLWEMTAEELYALAGAREELLAALYGVNELLAFNTAALVRTAVNAPARFPKTPEEAFPKKRRGWQEAKAEMEKIADIIGKGVNRT